MQSKQTGKQLILDILTVFNLIIQKYWLFLNNLNIRILFVSADPKVKKRVRGSLLYWSINNTLNTVGILQIKNKL